MNVSCHALGQAIFLKTDSADCQEVRIPFRSLEELFQICSRPQENLLLEKVVVYSKGGEEQGALTLGFISATQGPRAVL